MSVKQIADQAVANLNKRITDEIFLIIQKDRELMHKYLREIEANGLDSVNQQIGKEVKKAYGLTNAEARQEKPKSTLIKSHQQFD